MNHDSDSPFVNYLAPPLIFHSCHHKCGTHWLKSILSRVTNKLRLNFTEFNQDLDTRGGDIVFDQQSRIDTSKLDNYRGSHMIRDPRDIVVSGYFYHLWTKEKWVHRPQERFDNLTYQQYLRSIDVEDGLVAEISTSQFVFTQMRRWNYEDDRILELRYEDAFAAPADSFRPLFAHYGFSESAIELSMAVASQCGFEFVAGRKPGVVREGQVTRSGTSGQWRQYFTDRVKTVFRDETNGLVQFLKYEADDFW